MPIPAPHRKTESKQDFISRCMGDKVMNDDYDDQKQRAAVCYSQWEKHTAKASMVVVVGNDEYVEFNLDDLMAKDGPDDSKDTSDKVPSYDEDPNTPRLTPGIKPVSPKSSQPKEGDDKDSAPAPAPKPKETEDDGDNPDAYDETDVQAKVSYPYGSKCPDCDSATMSTERRTGPDAMETCANGHRYRRGVAIKIIAQASASFHPPENWERIPDLSHSSYSCYAGAGDWEGSWSAVAFQFNGSTISSYTRRVWGRMDAPQDNNAIWSEAGKDKAKAWIAAAKVYKDAEGMSDFYPEHFTKAAPIMGLKDWGVEKVEWKSVEAVKKPEREKAINERIKTASNPPEDQYPNPDKGGPGSNPNPDNSNAPANSDDVGSPPKLSSMPWFLASINPVYDELRAKWPLTFEKIERDFKRPNKPGNPGQEPKAQDSQKPDTKDEPYQMTTK